MDIRIDVFSDISVNMLQGCAFCKSTGVRIGNATRYTGYRRRLAVDVTRGNPAARGRLFQVTGAIDLRRMYSHVEHRAMAETAAAGGNNAPPLPYDGKSELHRVHYFDFTTLFPVPIAHALLHGVVKDFLSVLATRRRGGPPVEGMADRKRRGRGHIIPAEDMVRVWCLGQYDVQCSLYLL
jgi:hypothetical protein